MKHEFAKRRLEKLIRGIDESITAALLLIEDTGIAALKRKGKDWKEQEDIYEAASQVLGLNLLALCDLYESVVYRELLELFEDAE